MSDIPCNDNVQFPQLLEQIICDCGHGYEEHIWKCRHRIDTTVYNSDGLITAYECPCNEDKRSVELRWRLKKMKSERDDFMNERNAYMQSYNGVCKERDDFKRNLDFAIETLEVLRHGEMPYGKQYWEFAEYALKQLKGEK